MRIPESNKTCVKKKKLIKRFCKSDETFFPSPFNFSTCNIYFNFFISLDLETELKLELFFVFVNQICFLHVF